MKGLQIIAFSSEGCLHVTPTATRDIGLFDLISIWSEVHCWGGEGVKRGQFTISSVRKDQRSALNALSAVCVV
jgi:hypothetical protein